MVFKKSSFSELASDDKKSSKKRFGKKSKISVIFLLALVVLLACGGAYYMYFQKQQNSGNVSQVNLNEDQIKALLTEVGSKMELPGGETPDIATVTDVSKLAGQDFFKKAQNGDKVLIYRSSSKAILYRPSTGKIIEVAPVNLNTDSQGEILPGEPSESSPSAQTSNLSPTPAEKFKVVVLNSTKESGLAKKGADLLDEDVVEIMKTSNSIGEYDTTTITNVSKTKKISEKELKDIVSSYTDIEPEVTTKLPSDETAPSGSDIVVILGADFGKAY